MSKIIPNEFYIVISLNSGADIPIMISMDSEVYLPSGEKCSTKDLAFKEKISEDDAKSAFQMYSYEFGEKSKNPQLHPLNKAILHEIHEKCERFISEIFTK